jgi:dCTP deaminase
MLISDRELSERYRDMITPFVDSSVRIVDDKKVMSYGVTGYGYDVRCSNEFWLFSEKSEKNDTIIDPKHFIPSEKMNKYVGDYCIIPAGSFALGITVEYFVIPNNVKGILLTKSTYARCGVDCTSTALQPGWKGNLVIEISNCTPLPVIIYANEGIAEITFFKNEFQCRSPYSGKYQNQSGCNPK